MIKFLYLFIAIFIYVGDVCAQQAILPPVKHQIRLSGTFGELRTNHFHTGIDIKSSNGSRGDHIRTVWDGHISRIQIAIAGYGNALYIDHPNGVTSVYAHLHQFSPALDSFITAIQYHHQTFEIDTLLPDSLFPITQGDIIGKMGTSGYSFGPHLHFELRNTITERPINPLLEDLPIEDKIAPHIRSIYIYTLDENKDVISKKRISVLKTKVGYQLKDKNIKISGPYVAFGIETYDQANGSVNKNGIYQIDMSVGQVPSFAFTFDSLDFSYKTLINTHIDYAEKRKNNRQVHRCLLYNVGHPFLGDGVYDKGVVALSDTVTQYINFIVKDRNNNQSRLEFSVAGSENYADLIDLVQTNTYIPFHNSVLIQMGNMEAFLEKNSFESHHHIHVDTMHEGSTDLVSPIYHIGDDKKALLKPMRLSYDLSSIPDSLRGKSFIGQCQKKKYSNQGSLKDGHTLYTYVSALGDYAILLDTVAPVILPERWEDDWTDLSYISFIIKDNFDAKSKAKDLISHATIDGQWVLMKYDYKNDLIRYDMDIPLSAGPHEFNLKVTDDLGNIAVFNKTIVIK